MPLGINSSLIEVWGKFFAVYFLGHLVYIFYAIWYIRFMPSGISF